MSLMRIGITDEVHSTVTALSVAFQVNEATIVDQFLRRAFGLPNTLIADAIVTRCATLDIDEVLGNK